MQSLVTGHLQMAFGGHLVQNIFFSFLAVFSAGFGILGPQKIQILSVDTRK